VGVIGGGTRPNVVPDLAWAEVDARVLTYQAGQALDQAVRAIAATPQVPGTWIELEGGVSKGPMEKTAATSLLVELAHRVGDRLGLAFNDVLSGGTSDGNYIGELGVPTLDGLGPVGGRDHSPEEYLEADSIVPRTVFLAGLIAAMAGQREEIRARRGR
jgi:glutamate carboxypeptidase